MLALSASDTVERLKTTLKQYSSGFPQSSVFRRAVEEVLASIESNTLKVVTKLQEVDCDFEYEGVASLKYLMCSKCGTVYNIDSLSGSLPYSCKKCRAPLVPAYVGVPVESDGRLHHVQYPPAPKGASENLIAPTSDIYGINSCKKISPRSKKHVEILPRGIKPKVRERPLQSLSFTCPIGDSSCEYYDDPFCSYSSDRSSNKGRRISVLFPPLKGSKTRRAPTVPSPGLTKPFTVVAFTRAGDTESEKDITRELNADDIELGHFRIYELAPFYLIGSPNMWKGGRIPVLVKDDENSVIALGRSMQTKGLLVRLNYNRAKEAVEHAEKDLGGHIRIPLITLAHSVSHVLLSSVVKLTGLSSREFGEALYVNEPEKLIEVMVYDDSPGGIGGVETVKRSKIDFVSYVKNFSSPCRRMCRSACKACLYFDNCFMMNYLLNWRSSYYYLV
ncbi:MAG: DUF1998 domain-containing protein [Thermoproteota archaeon]|jgi:hypothetical protein